MSEDLNQTSKALRNRMMPLMSCFHHREKRLLGHMCQSLLKPTLQTGKLRKAVCILYHSLPSAVSRRLWPRGSLWQLYPVGGGGGGGAGTRERIEGFRQWLGGNFALPLCTVYVVLDHLGKFSSRGNWSHLPVGYSLWGSIQVLRPA